MPSRTSKRKEARRKLPTQITWILQFLQASNSYALLAAACTMAKNTRRGATIVRCSSKRDKKKVVAYQEVQDAERMSTALKALTEWEWNAFARTAAYAENRLMGAEIAVRYHPSKLPFIPGATQRFIFGAHHIRRAYGQAIAGWGAALVVAGT